MDYSVYTSRTPGLHGMRPSAGLRVVLAVSGEPPTVAAVIAAGSIDHSNGDAGVDAGHGADITPAVSDAVLELAAG